MRLSYSLSKNVRNRCKLCHSDPKFFFYIADKRINKSLKPKARAPTIVSDFYLKVSPKYFDSITYFSCYLQEQYKVGTRYFQYNKSRFSGKMPIQIAVTCKCGKTIWYTPNEKKPNKADRYFDRKLKYLL